MGVILKIVDKGNPFWTNQGLPRDTLLIWSGFLSCPCGQSRPATPPSISTPCVPLSLSSYLSFSSYSRVVVFLHDFHYHPIAGGVQARDVGEEQSSMIECLESRSEMSNCRAHTGRWSPCLRPRFGWFRRRLTSFPDETTCFGTSVQRPTKLYPFCWSNHHRWEVDYYSHCAFYDFFQWIGIVSWGETPQILMYSS